MTMPSSPPEFRVGAVAMIDALGFRGIWQRYAESEVLAKLQHLADTTNSDAADLQDAARRHGGNIVEFVRPSFLSDTIVFGVATKPLDVVTAGLNAAGWKGIIEFDNDSLAGEAVRVAAELLAVLVRRGLEGPIPFAFRGAIAFGRFGMTDRFVIGPAIDEVAIWMNCAQGAFVVLAPSAARYPQAEVPSSISKLVRYSVPLKRSQCGGQEFDTLVVSPFAGVDDSTRQDLLARLIESFGAPRTQDVEEKLDNTRKFLAAAEMAEKSLFAELLANAMKP